MSVSDAQPISTANLKAAMQAAENKWGGGIPEARVLYYGVKNNTSDTITSGTTSTVTIDMDGYSAIVIVPADLIIGSTLVLKSDMKDGYYQWKYNINDGGYRFTLLPDGRWKISSENKYGRAGSKIAAIIGIKSSTKTTEVSTMSITSDQPISAGNLKAALDGLTGGGRS